MKSEAFLPKGADRAAAITFLVDGNTLDWLQSESDRTGIGIEKLASAMLRKACLDAVEVGAPSLQAK